MDPAGKSEPIGKCSRSSIKKHTIQYPFLRSAEWDSDGTNFDQEEDGGDYLTKHNHIRDPTFHPIYTVTDAATTASSTGTSLLRRHQNPPPALPLQVIRVEHFSSKWVKLSESLKGVCVEFSCIVPCNFCCSSQVLQFFSMSNLQSTPSSSTTTAFQKKYDFFLNFRGEDTRDCFTCHLHRALHTKVETFIDDGLENGDGIWPTLKGAIEQSKISVVIFSNDYASSKWCLRELVEIMERKNMRKQIVIPVFYRVDPSDVRKQTGSFKDSFDKHGNESQGEERKRREALTEASNLVGFDSSKTR
ncbi:hypothetical protein Ddye_028117 [Dipteronia dyeriana]|uniref:TIR domain-containing protein n=1 Tax=Dipteronia dyeriana TaxID=168575 RepID=A0AAD9WS25_9ROSI|nr:hypothetical protein Ddye_028117 [Dipteronia dyeriana]